MGPRAARKYDDTDDALLTPLGEFMQRRNAELSLTVSTVAQRVGMSRASWYRIARGESASPGMHLLRGLARVYRVRAAELFALAASAEATPSPSVTRPGSHAPEAGDALWRCHYERRHRAGSTVEVRLDLQNLSDRAWVGAEVRSVHPGWIDLAEASTTAPRVRPLAAPGHPAAVQLPPTSPGEWAQASLAMPTPPGPGAFAAALGLHLGNPPRLAGSGALLLIETR